MERQRVGDWIEAYRRAWEQATADQEDVQVRFGDPVVDGDRVAVEWWTTMLAGGDAITLAGCLVLAFAPRGRGRPVRRRRLLPLRAVPGPAPGSRRRPRLHPRRLRHRG